MINDERVVPNQDIFRETYTPTKILSREIQIDELTSCLSPSLKGKKPMNVWIFGKPGTGKTLISKNILTMLKKDGRVNGADINCWEHNSYYSVLDKLVIELRILGAEKLNTSYKLERLRQCIGKIPFIIILDEIDKPEYTERDSIIYNLSNIENITLICICNSGSLIYTMDDRIKSRLNAKHIEFNPYSQKDLIDMLKQKAELALSPESWNIKILEKIAQIAEGDVRIAFQILKNAAYKAENDRSKTIKNKHILESHNPADSLKTNFYLSKMTSHHKMLYELVKKRNSVKSGEPWKAYLKECRSLNKQPIALRTYSEYMNKLIKVDLVHWDRALVKGKVRLFSIHSRNN